MVNFERGEGSDPRTPPPPCVRHCLRQRVFDAVHQLSLPSHEMTYELIRKRITLPYMRKDIQAMVHSCPACQQSKDGKNTIPPLQPIKTPEVRFSHWHVDVVGLLYPFKRPNLSPDHH